MEAHDEVNDEGVLRLSPSKTMTPQPEAWDIVVASMASVMEPIWFTFAQGLFDERGVRHEEVVAHNMLLLADSIHEQLEGIPIVLVEGVLCVCR